MAATSGKSVPRPLSPHLQIYRPQLTSGMSILHRITGVALTLSLPILVVWLVAAAMGQDSYQRFYACANSNLGRFVFSGMVFAFAYHLCAGIRHLLWDAGWFLDLKAAYTTGYIALAAAAGLTIALLTVIWS